LPADLAVGVGAGSDLDVGAVLVGFRERARWLSVADGPLVDDDGEGTAERDAAVGT
jgi:hypothetical protein